MTKSMDRYEILLEIGRGGFATVYQARDTELDRLVALKELNPLLLTDTEWLQRFRREARLIARLNHPHIVTIHDIGQALDRQFLIMQLIEGPDLEQLLADQGKLPWSDVLRIMTAIADGLDYAHAHDVLHRDLKPSNILVDPKRGAMISDFGLAKIMSGHNLSQTGDILGTPHYIAPEIWESQPATPHSDVYALGCILHELLTGEKLFVGKTPPAVMMAHFQTLTLPETWPEDIPSGVNDVLRMAVAKQPLERYNRAGDLVHALSQLTSPGQITPIRSSGSTSTISGPPVLPLLQVNLLGGFHLTYDNQLVPDINQARQQSLLAYLMLNAKAPQSRQHLSYLFWPDSTEAQARTNLRYLLHQLRRSFPSLEQYLQIGTKTLHWSPPAPFKLDVALFKELVTETDQMANSNKLRETLERAVELYQGELLPSCYDEWIIPFREQLNQNYIEVLERLIDLLESQSDYRTGVRYAQRLLNHDPVREATHRHLMRLHERAGNRANALRVYYNCVSILKQELDVEPGPQTQSLYQQLLNRPSLPISAEQSRPFSAVTAARLKLVGRQHEWDQLQQAWQSAGQGPPGFILISGEAGIGKSRLAEEMLIWAGQRAIPTTQTRSYAAEGRLAYAPVAAWLRSAPYQSKLAQLDSIYLADLARLLPEILVDYPDLPHNQAPMDNWQRQRLFEAMARAVLLNQPAVLHLDDLQWCDQETMEWLHFLLRFDLNASLLVIGTVRSEEVDPAHPLTHLLRHLRPTGQLAEIDLGPLDAKATAALASLVADQALNDKDKAAIYDQTEGSPLFVVETIRAGLSSSQKNKTSSITGSDATESMPPKIQAIIQARLTQLSEPARKLAGLAAVIGRSFTYDVLAYASSMNEDEMVQSLDELWQRRVVREQGLNEYDFSHDRIREVAYGQASAAQRRLMHRRVAEAIETVAVGNLDEMSGQLAAHYESADLTDKAIEYYQKAGKVALQIHANSEAVIYFQHSLRLLDHIADSPQRDQLKLELLTSLGVPLVVLEGYSAKIVRETYNQAYELCRKIGRAPSGPVLRALALSGVVRQEFAETLEYGRQLLHLAEDNQDRVLETEAYYVLGVTLFWQGRYIQARKHLAQGLVVYQPENRNIHLRLFSQDPRVICQSRLAVTLWYLGYPDQAISLSHKALALARQMLDPMSLGYVLSWTAILHHFLGDVNATLETAEAAIKLSNKHGLPFWLGMSQFYYGWARAMKGDVEIGMKDMRNGAATLEKGKAGFCLPYFSGRLAECEAKLGLVDDGLARISEALDQIKTRGENWCLAELTRLKADMLFRQGVDAAVVEKYYKEAIDVASQQEAKSLELRATMSLCRLRQKQGGISEAKQMLTTIYDQFTEGFDTPDLIDASTLIKELS